jgi:hypothetical protein
MMRKHWNYGTMQGAYTGQALLLVEPARLAPELGLVAQPLAVLVQAPDAFACIAVSTPSCNQNGTDEP